MRRKLLSLVSCVLCVATTVSATAQDVGELLPFVPEDANTIAVVRARQLKESARGRAEDWSEQHEARFLAGDSTIPPWVQLLMRASYVQPGGGGREWTAVLLPVPANYSMADLATHEQSELQTIGTHDLVLSQRHGGYFVELTDPMIESTRVLGGLAPASRQDAARWIDETEAAAGAVGVSDYLVQAASDESVQVVLAIDTHHMLDPAMIAHRLDGCVALQGHDEEKAALAQAFTELRGVTLSISVDNAVYMAVRLDFDVELGDEAQFVKPVFLELLNDMGAVLDELETVEPFIYAQSVSLETPLSDESLRRVLSLITAPSAPSVEETTVAATTAATDTPTGDTPPTETEPEIDMHASRRYLDAVNRNLDDLSRAYQRANNYERTAHWHDNYAERIDRISTRGVDPDLVKYANWVSSALRALGTSLRGTAVDVGALENTIYYHEQYFPVYSGAQLWWGVPRTVYGAYTYGQPMNVQVQTNLQEVREQQAAAVQASSPEREQIWQMINEERSETQKAMIDRYGTTFDN